MRIVKSIFTKRRTQELQRLVDRYLEGGTTLDEERQLFRAFASGRYPAELEEYAAMFRGCAAVAGIKPEEVRTPARRRIIRIALTATTGVAAAALLCLTLATNMRRAELERVYGGSYVIVNGERIDDLSKIMPQIERTLADAEAVERKLEEQRVVNRVENDMLNDISDPAEREMIRQLISN